MQFPITIGLRRSRFLDSGLLLLHGLTVSVLALTPWPIFVRVVLVLLALGAGIWTLRVAAPVATALRLYADGSLQLGVDASSGDEKSWVLPGAYAHPVLVAFRVQEPSGGMRAIIVLPDSTSSDDARRLRVWLRWKVSARAKDDA